MRYLYLFVLTSSLFNGNNGNTNNLRSHETDLQLTVKRMQNRKNSCSCEKLSVVVGFAERNPDKYMHQMINI